MSKKISAAALFLFVFMVLLFSAYTNGWTQTSASQTLTLKAGFNFVSFTLQSYLSPQKLMELNNKITDIYSYNAAAGSFISATDGALSSIVPGKGYIVKANTEAYLNTSGTAAGTIGDITLRSGFNLVGFSKSVTSTTFSSLMSGYSIIKGMYKWNAASGAFMQVVRNSAGAVELLDGVDPAITAEQAYFINVTGDTTLNYDAGTVIVGGQAPITPVVKSLGMITLSRPSIAAALSASIDLASAATVNAVYTDGTSAAVTASWTLKSGGGSLAGTVYTAPNAAATVVLTAAYTEGGTTKTADLTISVQTGSYTQGAENIADSLPWKWTDPDSVTVKLESTNRIDITVPSNKALNEIYNYNAPRYTKSVTGDFVMYVRGFPNPFVAQYNGLGLLVEDPTAAGAGLATSKLRLEYGYTSGIKMVSLTTQSIVGSTFIDLHDIYLKLERVGNKFTGYERDPNVSEWTKVGEITMVLPAAIDAGIILTNQSNQSNFSAYFTDFAIYSLTSAVSNSVTELTLSKTSDTAATGTAYDLSLITATAKYSNGTSKAVTPSWDVLIGSGSLSSGKYTVQTTSENDVLRASYTENGVSVSALFKLSVSGTTITTSVFPNEYAAAGTVTLPAGAQTALTDLIVYSNISSSSVSLSGSFSASVGADTGITVAPVMAVNKSGNPAMMKLAAISGTTTDSEPISAATTADALVLFDPCFYKLSSADFQKAKTLLASNASRAELVALVENAVKTDPTAPLDGTAHADIYAKAVAISADILAQIPSAAVISTAGPDRYTDGTDQNKDIYIEDDSEHNSPYVTIVNKTYCYYDVTAYNTKQLNSFNFLPKCEVLPKVDWSWPPGITSSARNDVYMGDGELEFHFRKNQLLTTANIASSVISIAIGVNELKGTQLKAKEEALKIAGGAVASFFQKWLNYTAPATKKEAVLAVISFGGDICSIAADITFLLYPDLKDNLKGRILNVSFIKNAFAILESKLNAWKYASTAFSAADTAFSLWSLTNAEVFLDYQGRQENGYYPKTATPDTQNKTIDLGGGTLMELVYINPGTFTMGSPDSDTLSSVYEKPQHQVTITKGFWIGKYEVTQKQWTAIMGTNPSPPGYGIGDSYPVHKINSSDCFSFISKLNAKQLIAGTFKLPTEAQWEYACRAGTTTPYYLTAADPMSACGWYSGNSKTDSTTGTMTAHPVGQKTPNAFGLYDMLGNAGEFCSDMYAGASYTSDAATDPTGETGYGAYSSHVIRGGNFYVDAKYCRSASRSYSLDEATQAVGSVYGVYNVGLRVILAQ